MSRHSGGRFWRRIAPQLLVLALLGLAIGSIILTTSSNLRARGIPVGFEFLGDRAGFSIAESVLPYSRDDSNLWAVATGVGNTLFVSAFVAFFATCIGALVGIARMSSNTLLSGLARTWIEVARNTPLLLILVFLYAAWWQLLPAAAPVELAPGVLASIRGLAVPAVSIARDSGGVSLAVDWPRADGLDLSGGQVFSPELLTILFGLTFYTVGFIAEIVRAGIASIPRGQWEAARALGLRTGRVLALVILPQMMRVVVPPMSSQYINVVKNSTLALAVGYSDLMNVMGTIINKTSHAVEGTALIVSVYLSINLGISLLMNAYNRRLLRQGAR